MPISPIPPSAMNTNSSRGPAAGSALVCHQPASPTSAATSITSPNAMLRCRPSRSCMSSAPPASRPTNVPSMRSVPVLTLQPSPAGPALIEPGRPHSGESRSAVPHRKPALHGRCQKTQHRLGLEPHAVLRQIGCGAAQIGRMPGQIEADADHGDRSLVTRNAFGEDARALGLPDQHIVGPLEPQARRRAISRLTDGVHHGNTGEQRELGQHCRRTGQRHQQAGVQIARLRCPLPPRTPPPGRLAPGHDPQRTQFARLGALKRLAVGGADCIENDTAKGRHGGSFRRPTVGFRTGSWLPCPPPRPTARARRRTAGCRAP